MDTNTTRLTSKLRTQLVKKTVTVNTGIAKAAINTLQMMRVNMKFLPKTLSLKLSDTVGTKKALFGTGMPTFLPRLPLLPV